MNITEYTTFILKASEGHFLTQADDIPDINRIVADTVYLARAENSANWKEITEEEGLLIRELKRKQELEFKNNE